MNLRVHLSIPFIFFSFVRIEKRLLDNLLKCANLCNRFEIKIVSADAFSDFAFIVKYNINVNSSDKDVILIDHAFFTVKK